MHLSNPGAAAQSNAPGHRRLRRGDLILFAGLLALILLLLLGYALFFQKKGGAVEISVDGKALKTLSLDRDIRYPIVTHSRDASGSPHQNILQIKDGYASIVQADCPDKLCVHQKKINKKGETLICLPHKVIVTVISSPEEKKYDGIAN